MKQSVRFAVQFDDLAQEAMFFAIRRTPPFPTKKATARMLCMPGSRVCSGGLMLSLL
jgi:hypothetical protein